MEPTRTGLEVTFCRSGDLVLGQVFDCCPGPPGTTHSMTLLSSQKISLCADMLQPWAVVGGIYIRQSGRRGPKAGASLDHAAAGGWLHAVNAVLIASK